MRIQWGSVAEHWLLAAYTWMPTGRVLRLVTPTAPWRCSGWWWCSLGGPGAIVREVSVDEAARLAARVAADGVLLDGGEPLLEVSEEEVRRLSSKLPVAARSVLHPEVAAKLTRLVESRVLSGVLVEVHACRLDAHWRVRVSWTERLTVLLDAASRVAAAVDIILPFDGSKLSVKCLEDAVGVAATRSWGCIVLWPTSDAAYAAATTLASRARRNAGVSIVVHGDWSGSSRVVCPLCGREALILAPEGVIVRGNVWDEVAPPRLECRACGAVLGVVVPPKPRRPAARLAREVAVI